MPRHIARHIVAADPIGEPASIVWMRALFLQRRYFLEDIYGIGEAGIWRLDEELFHVIHIFWDVEEMTQ